MHSADILYQNSIGNQPYSIEPITGSTTDDRSIFTFKMTDNVDVRIPTSYGTAQGYYGGYINGYLTFTLNLSPTWSVPNLNYTRFDVNPDLVNNESLHVSVIDAGKSGNNFIVRLNVIFTNYSLLNQNVYRYINLGQIATEISCMGDNTSDAPLLTLTAGITNISANINGNPVADAGSSYAGQLYSAIENSTSVSDIINYLNLIEDASGDINIAVAHINEQLLPSVIGYLANIYTHTATMNQTTQNIRTYLYAISSTWPQYSAQVLFYLQQLVEMNQEQSSIAEEYQQEYASKAAQSATEAAGMQAVLPNVSASDFDIGSQLDSGTVTTLSAFWAMFPQNGFIGTLFAIAIAGIAAGYFLYGKKS